MIVTPSKGDAEFCAAAGSENAEIAKVKSVVDVRNFLKFMGGLSFICVRNNWVLVHLQFNEKIDTSIFIQLNRILLGKFSL